MSVILHAANGVDENPLLLANARRVGPYLRSKFCRDGFAPILGAEHDMNYILSVGVRHVSHLRCLPFYTLGTQRSRAGLTCDAPTALEEGGACRRRGCLRRLRRAELAGGEGAYGARGGAELAGGEGVEGAKANGEFGGGQAALAVEAAEKIGGGGNPFLGVAFHATGDQVAVGIESRPRSRDDVVQALDRRRGVAQAIEALLALARVDGVAQWL